MPKSAAENIYIARFHGDPSRPEPYPHGKGKGGSKKKGARKDKNPRSKIDLPSRSYIEQEAQRMEKRLDADNFKTLDRIVEGRPAKWGTLKAWVFRQLRKKGHSVKEAEAIARKVASRYFNK